MKSYDLLPTYQNIKEALLNDTLKRNVYLFRFISLLQNIEDANCSIALDGQWGAGKTFFVQQAKLILDTINPYIRSENIPESVQQDFLAIKELAKKYSVDAAPQLCAYYNAWENDNLEDPVLSLVHSISQTVSTEINLTEGKRDVGEVVKSIFGLVHFQFSMPLENQKTLTVDFDGQRVSNIIDSLKKKKEFGVIDNELKLRSEINEFLNSLLPEKANRLVVFVDELDRCQPVFAVKLLERIKHYFNNENVTFVFSTNLAELQNTIRKLYGTEFNASRYLDKFFDITLNLPSLEKKDYFSYLGFSDINTWDRIKLKIIENCNLELREINRFMKITNISSCMLRKKNPNLWDEEKYYHLIIDCISPLMIALKMTDKKIYEDFIFGNNPEPLFNLLLDNKKLLDYFGFISNDPTDLRTARDGIKSLYESIFKKTQQSDSAQTICGVSVYGNIRKKLLSITSLLSEYADYDE